MKKMIICDLCRMINHSADNFLEHITAFKPHTIHQRVDQYKSKHGSTTKVEPVNWKPNPPIIQYHHHSASYPVILDIK